MKNKTYFTLFISSCLILCCIFNSHEVYTDSTLQNLALESQVKPNQIIIKPTNIIQPIPISTPTPTRIIDTIDIIPKPVDQFVEIPLIFNSILFEENFNNGIANGWSVGNAYTKLINGALFVQSVHPVSYVCYTQATFSMNGTYSVQAKDYFSEPASALLGLCFGLKNLNPVTGYGIFIRKNENDENRWCFGRFNYGVWSMISPWTTTDAFTNINSFTEIIARVENNTVDIFINGYLMGNFTIPTFVSGKIALWVEPHSNSNTDVVIFDNVKVTSSGPTPTPPMLEQPSFLDDIVLQIKSTPTPISTPTPTSTPTPLANSNNLVYENNFEYANLPSSDITEIKGTFAGLFPASSSLTNNVPTGDDNYSVSGKALQVTVQPNQGTTFLFGTPIPVNGIVYVRACAWANNPTAQIHLGILDTDANGNPSNGGGSIGMEQCLNTYLFDSQWGLTSAIHRSSTGYVTPLIQVVGVSTTTEVYLDNLQVYDIPENENIPNNLLW